MEFHHLVARFIHPAIEMPTITPHPRVMSQRRRATSLALAVLLIGSVGCSSIPPKAPMRPHARIGHSLALRVGTYNIFVGARNLEQTAKVIRRMDADIVALQEVVPRSAAFLDTKFSGGYRYRYFAGGLGLMSRFPMRHPHFERSRRGINGFIFADIDHPQGRIQLVNLHLDPLRIWTIPDILTLPSQLWWQKRAIQRTEVDQVLVNLRPNRPTILLGDFNRVNDGAINRLGQFGFIDSFAEVTPKADRTPTLNFSIFGIRSGRRIDFIFHNKAFDTCESEVLVGRPSDHDAILGILCWQGPKTHKRGQPGKRKDN